MGERENNFADRICASTASPSSDLSTETSASLHPLRHTMGPLRLQLTEEVNPVSEDTRFPWRRGFMARIEGSGRAGMLMLIAADLNVL